MVFPTPFPDAILQIGIHMVELTALSPTRLNIENKRWDYYFYCRQASISASPYSTISTAIENSGG